MKILVLNGSPRKNGNTTGMVAEFCRGARAAGHETDVVEVAHLDIHGCLGCEYCHTKGAGTCIQQDGMQEIYPRLLEAQMLVLASPIYYHGFSGQLKCVIDRFYAVAYPEKPEKLQKAAMLLSSGAPNMYDGAMFSFQGDFLDYMGLENMGVYTACGEENGKLQTLDKLYVFGKSL